MSNYMTLEELHSKLGRWLRENPEHKNELVIGAFVADGLSCRPSDENVPGSILIRLAETAAEDSWEDGGTLELMPPRVGKYVM